MLACLLYQFFSENFCGCTCFWSCLKLHYSPIVSIVLMLVILTSHGVCNCLKQCRIRCKTTTSRSGVASYMYMYVDVSYFLVFYIQRQDKEMQLIVVKIMVTWIVYVLLTRSDMLQRLILNSLFPSCHICKQLKTHLQHVSNIVVHWTSYVLLQYCCCIIDYVSWLTELVSFILLTFLEDGIEVVQVTLLRTLALSPKSRCTNRHQQGMWAVKLCSSQILHLLTWMRANIDWAV